MTAFIEPDELRCAELFFHVFAHVAETSTLPASVASRDYVAWCAARLGAAQARPLGEDARLLAREFPSHAALARVQPLSRLFSSINRLTQVEARGLAELLPGDVDEAWALAPLQLLGAGAELALCAMLLELPSFLQLPAPPPFPDALRGRLVALAPVAPGLERARIGLVRSLHLRGRAWGDEIWVGHPAAEVAPPIEHAAWQAAHEATVVAVAREEPDLSERAVEATAVERLTQRAQAAGEDAGHGAWLQALTTLSY